MKGVYYAAYDISDDNTRTSVIHSLKNHGFVRIQKSLFCANMSGQQKKDLMAAVKLLLSEDDSFYLILSCNTCFGKIETIGRGFDADYVAGRKGAVVL